MKLSGHDFYATVKASINHAINQDFLYNIAENNSVDYVYYGSKKRIIVDLSAVGQTWDAIKEKLVNDGWNTYSTPSLLDIFENMVLQNIFHIEFHDDHPKLKWLVWYTPYMYTRIKPLSYDTALLSYNELSEEKKLKVSKMEAVISPETMNEKKFISVGHSEIYNIDNAVPAAKFTTPEISSEYDSLILKPSGERLLLKVNKEKSTVDIAMIMN